MFVWAADIRAAGHQFVMDRVRQGMHRFGASVISRTRTKAFSCLGNTFSVGMKMRRASTKI